MKYSVRHFNTVLLNDERTWCSRTAFVKSGQCNMVWYGMKNPAWWTDLNQNPPNLILTLTKSVHQAGWLHQYDTSLFVRWEVVWKNEACRPFTGIFKKFLWTFSWTVFNYIIMPSVVKKKVVSLCWEAMTKQQHWHGSAFINCTANQKWFCWSCTVTVRKNN